VSVHGREPFIIIIIILKKLQCNWGWYLMPIVVGEIKNNYLKNKNYSALLTHMNGIITFITNFQPSWFLWREELCEAHSNMLLTLSNPRNIQNHNYGITSLFIKTHTGWQACRQAGRQASTGAGKQRKARQGKSGGHPGYHSHNHKCEWWWQHLSYFPYGNKCCLLYTSSDSPK
jgi:hypothetical protein